MRSDDIFQFKFRIMGFLSTSFIFIFVCHFSYTKNPIPNNSRIVTYLLCSTIYKNYRVTVL